MPGPPCPSLAPALQAERKPAYDRDEVQAYMRRKSARLKAERAERQRLEERLSKLEHMRDAGQLPAMESGPAPGELRLNLPSIAAAASDIAQAEPGVYS